MRRRTASLKGIFVGVLDGAKRRMLSQDQLSASSWVPRLASLPPALEHSVLRAGLPFTSPALKGRTNSDFSKSDEILPSCFCVRSQGLRGNSSLLILTDEHSHTELNHREEKEMGRGTPCAEPGEPLIIGHPPFPTQTAFAIRI